ncbi:diguanylate cyclase (GGDEF)-like protein [Mycobacterium frederiksbergense]|uniref:Diguanylate cyclase (GGDEF)-like protein n=1 Tax=Mycolicibacterium frederiksbergense TaxID=117567 RepID=A0ABT6KXQ5_9MYCO|nr:GGDEF domain-containing protein [Mycolicibacterium frederiksbergense]MDH6195488.1 diguanylate cyclase (GGDEF)-like protein [Mycolicibacterium frederiksbergense]
MPRFGAVLRQRTLLTYLAILLGLYASAVLLSGNSDAVRGEWAATGLCVIGLVAAGVGRPLTGWLYGLALACACAAPVSVLLFHDEPTAQVWALIPLMFSAIYIRTWHSIFRSRVAATAIAVAAIVALCVAPAEVPGQWLLLFAVCITGAAEVFGTLQSALLEAALRDPLTSVWNRAGLDQQGAVLLSRAQRRGEPLAVIALDVDGFKTLNDRDGHPAGDRVLTELTTRWLSQLPTSAELGRVGGDEFIVIVTGYDHAEARRLAAELGSDGPVPVSAGLAVGYPRTVNGLVAMVARADEDLYRLKRLRRDAAQTSDISDS